MRPRTASAQREQPPPARRACAPPSTIGTGRRGRGGGEVAQPRVRDPLGQQQVRGEAVLGAGQPRLVGPEPVRRAGPGCRSARRRRAPRRARRGAAGPSRSSSRPSTLRGGRRFGRPRCAASGAVRRPRSSTRPACARACRAPSPRRSAPTSARDQQLRGRVGGDRPKRDQPLADGSDVAVRQRGRSAAPRGPPEEQRRPAACRRRTADAAGREVADRHAGRLRQPARQRVVAGEVGEAARAPRRRRRWRRIGRVAVVREGATARRRGPRDERREVARRWPAASTRRPGRPARPCRSSRDESPQPGAERHLVRQLRRTTTASAPAAANRRRVAHRERRPRIASRSRFERPARAPRAGARMTDGDRRHTARVYRREGLDVARVRAYVGLGANVGDADRDARGGDPRARGAPGRAAPRRVAPVRDGARRRHRPARVPERGRRARRARRPAPGRRRAGAAHRAQGPRAGVRAPGAGALGTARGRPRPARVRPPPDRRRAAAGGPQRRPGQGRRCRWSSRMPRRATGCSCSRRSRTSRPASCRPAGASRSRRPGTGQLAAEGPDAVRPIARWDGERRDRDRARRRTADGRDSEAGSTGLSRARA